MKIEIELSEKQVELLNDLIEKEVDDLQAYQDDFLKWQEEGSTQYDETLKEIEFKLNTYLHIQHVFVTEPAMRRIENTLKHIAGIRNIKNEDHNESLIK